MMKGMDNNTTLAAEDMASTQKPCYTPVPNDMAKQMIQHYLSNKVDHSLDAIVRFIKVQPGVLKEISKGRVDKIKFCVAAYLDSHKPTVLIQQKLKTKKPQYIYYDLLSLRQGMQNDSNNGICPPPYTPPCPVEEQSV